MPALAASGFRRAILKRIAREGDNFRVLRRAGAWRRPHDHSVFRKECLRMASASFRREE